MADSTHDTTGHHIKDPSNLAMALFFAGVAALVAALVWAVATFGIVALILTGVAATALCMALLIVITAGG
ncbi:hypothetical protein EOM89_02965 [Candidatus Falkowbacteria bacterium]|nr:hypothetical protein [Candidatus Falkowbacteria bacterium]